MSESRDRSRRLERAAVSVAAVALGLLATSIPTSAEAASSQGLCSSGNSVIGSVIDLQNVRTGVVEAKLFRTECTYLPRGAYRVIYKGAKSYRVGYNFGPYSKDCRTNNSFIPWKKADNIYFRLYTTASCVNP